MKWFPFRRRGHEKALEALSRAFSPLPDPETHSCLEKPYPWTLAAQAPVLLLKPCEFCKHAIQAHTYDSPCSQCVLEEQMRQMIRAILTGVKAAP